MVSTKSCLILAVSGITPALATTAHAQDTEAVETAALPDAEGTIVVTGFKRDYLANEDQTVALGIDLSQVETPAAVSVISQDILQDQQVNNVDDALRNVAGVTKFKTGNGGEEKFSIRGFDASQSIYKDGARINNALNASNIPSTETANLERIEVLKGPSALLYGQGQPGGIINYITKRPLRERYTGVELVGGTDAYYRAEFDTTGPIPTAGGFLGYRLVAAYENSDSFRDEVQRERLLVNPSLAFYPKDELGVTVGFEYIDDNYTQDRGQVLDGNAVEGYFYSDRQDDSQFYGIPNWNRNTEAQSQRFYILGEARLSDFWHAELTYSQTSNQKTNVDSTPLGITAVGDIIGPVGSAVENLVMIQPRMTTGSGEARQVTVKNFFDFTGPAGFDHQILASYTFEDFETGSTSFRGDRNVFYNVATREYFTTFDPAETADPDFRQPTPMVGFVLNNRGSSLNQEFEEQGVNALDYIRLNDRISVLVGGRYSKFKDTLSGYEDDNFSLRGGLVFMPRPNLSFYASYAEGYEPSGGLLDIDDRQIDPETSVSYELGGKLALRDERLLITAALFNVTQQGKPFVVNPTALPADIRYGNIGEVRTRGAEFEIVGQITEAWRLQGGYAYLDNEITDGGVAAFGAAFPVGNSLGGIAKHNFNIFTFYEFELGSGELGLGGGVFAQSDVFISIENNAEYDGWAQVDLAAYYKQDFWKAQVNVSNLFDEEYRLAQAGTDSDSFAAVRVGTSSPLRVVGSIALEF